MPLKLSLHLLHPPQNATRFCTLAETPCAPGAAGFQGPEKLGGHRGDILEGTQSCRIRMKSWATATAVQGVERSNRFADIPTLCKEKVRVTGEWSGFFLLSKNQEIRLFLQRQQSHRTQGFTSNQKQRVTGTLVLLCLFRAYSCTFSWRFFVLALMTWRVWTKEAKGDHKKAEKKEQETWWPLRHLILLFCCLVF